MAIRYEYTGLLPYIRHERKEPIIIEIGFNFNIQTKENFRFS